MKGPIPGEKPQRQGEKNPYAGGKVVRAGAIEGRGVNKWKKKDSSFLVKGERPNGGTQTILSQAVGCLKMEDENWKMQEKDECGGGGVGEGSIQKKVKGPRRKGRQTTTTRDSKTVAPKGEGIHFNIQEKLEKRISPYFARETKAL